MAKTKIVKIVRSVLERIVETVSLVIFAILIFIGLYAFYDAGSVTKGSTLGDDILAVSPEKNDGVNPLEGVKDINEDIVGWIKIKNTGIDHPVLQSSNNSDYLVRNYKKEYSTSGSAFLDYKNNRFKDEYSVVYGHRMSDGLMFSDITKYTDERYFNDHIEGTLWTEDGIYDAFVVGFAVFNAGEVNIYDVDYFKDHAQEAYTSLNNHFMYKSNYQYEAGDKVLLLSTCDSAGRQKRDVLLLKLIKQ